MSSTLLAGGLFRKLCEEQSDRFQALLIVVQEFDHLSVVSVDSKRTWLPGIVKYGRVWTDNLEVQWLEDS